MMKTRDHIEVGRLVLANALAMLPSRVMMRQDGRRHRIRTPSSLTCPFKKGILPPHNAATCRHNAKTPSQSTSDRANESAHRSMPMHPFRIKVFISRQSAAVMSAMLLLGGIVICAGWLTGNPAATRLYFKSGPIAAIGGLAWILIGSAYLASTLLRPVLAARARAFLATGVVALGSIGALGMASDFPGRVLHLPPYLWKMHPVAIFVFLTIGLMLPRLSAAPSRANQLFIRIGTALLAALAAILILNEFINTDYIFMTDAARTPALAGGLLLVVATLGMWGLWRDAEWNRRSDENAEPSQIYWAMDVLVTSIVVIVALIAFGLSQGRTQEIMMDQMGLVAKDKRTLFETVISSAYGKALLASERPVMAATLAGPLRNVASQPPALDRLNAAVRSLVKRDFSAFSVSDLDGKVVASAGKFVVAPEQRIKLLGKQGVELLWDDGYVLRTDLPVLEGDRPVGHTASEQRLDDLTKIHWDASHGAGTNDMVVCARNGNRQQCFPFRWSATSGFFPAYLDGKPLPLTRASSGETAVDITTDFRRQRVMAALGPIGDTGLGMAVKRDMVDLYAPIRKQFFNTLPFLVLLILASIAVTRAKLHPLVESLNEASEKMRAMALTDPLTGLPNRALFNDRLQSSMLRSKRSKNMMALMFVDLDKFKTVNDKHGHNKGDDVLKWCAAQLKLAVRESDGVARLGGDEFTVILENVSNVEIVERVAQNIIDAIARYKISFPTIEVADFGASIGIALYKDDARSPKELIEAADSALYSCKHAGRASFCVADYEGTEALSSRQALPHTS